MKEKDLPELERLTHEDLSLMMLSDRIQNDLNNLSLGVRELKNMAEKYQYDEKEANLIETNFKAINEVMEVFTVASSAIMNTVSNTVKRSRGK